MKKTLKLIFSRFTIVAIAIILQVMLWIFIPVIVNNRYPNALISINFIIAILDLLLIIWIINSDMKIECQLPLIILCILAPALGVVFCALFVRVKIPKKIKRYFTQTIEQTKIANTTEQKYYENLKEKLGGYYNQFNYLNNTANFKSYENTNVVFFDDGKKFFDDLLIELNKAEKFIFMEYFIIEKGEIWNSIHEVLKAKVKDGIKVRLMYDDLGTISRLP